MIFPVDEFVLKITLQPEEEMLMMLLMSFTVRGGVPTNSVVFATGELDDIRTFHGSTGASAVQVSATSSCTVGTSQPLSMFFFVAD